MPYMTKEAIHKVVSRSTFFVEPYHDFLGITDAKRLNYDVVSNGKIRIIAKDKSRSKWQATKYVPSGKENPPLNVVILSEIAPLEELLKRAMAGEFDAW